MKFKIERLFRFIFLGLGYFFIKKYDNMERKNIRNWY